MYYFVYPWKEGEFENIITQIHSSTYKKTDERFIGPILPFLGGVLLGGLFLPRPVPTYVPYAQPYPQVGVPYSTPTPMYSTPVNTNVK